MYFILTLAIIITVYCRRRQQVQLFGRYEQLHLTLKRAKQCDRPKTDGQKILFLLETALKFMHLLYSLRVGWHPFKRIIFYFFVVSILFVSYGEPKFKWILFVAKNICIKRRACLWVASVLNLANAVNFMLILIIIIIPVKIVRTINDRSAC